MMKTLSLLALLLAACSQPAPKAENSAHTAAQATARPTLLHIPLAIQTAEGTHRFAVEVARTEAEQEKGLMFRKSLDPDGGMLFPMNPPRTASFWMKDTLIPLDMLFIKTDGTIAFIAANARPYSREPISAGVPVAAVLELKGGRAAELNIREGDGVAWGRCLVPGADIPVAEEFCPGAAR